MHQPQHRDCQTINCVIVKRRGSTRKMRAGTADVAYIRAYNNVYIRNTAHKVYTKGGRKFPFLCLFPPPPLLPQTLVYRYNQKDVESALA